MDPLLKELAGEGIIGLILAWFMFRNTRLTDKLFTIISNNTKAMTGLKGSVDGLTAAQNRRRKEFGHES